jgi:DNA polymerase-3 subunit alpha
MELILLDLDSSAEDGHATPVVLTLPAAKVTPDLIAQLKHTLRAHPGPCPVHIKLRGPRGDLVLAINEDYRVERSGAFLGDLKGLLGAGCLA